LDGALVAHQIDGRRLRRQERAVDELALREQLEWELAQAELAQQQLEREAASDRRRHMHHLRLAIEAQRLLSVVRTTAGQFVDSLATRPAKQSIEVGGLLPHSLVYAASSHALPSVLRRCSRGSGTRWWSSASINAGQRRA
jgi:hypothetical protein